MKKMTKWASLVLAVAVLFTGCAEDAATFVKDKYQFESVNGVGNEQQKIYRAPNQTVPQTAQQISSNDKPDEISKQDNKDMFLVYSDSVIHVQQDQQQPSDSLVEVDSKEYVKQNYDPTFLEGYMAASLISNIFGSNWSSYPHGTYRGYTGSTTYKSGGSYSGGSSKSSGGSYSGGSSKSSGGSYSGGSSKSSGGSYSGGSSKSSGGSYSTPSTPPRSSGGFSTPPRSSSGTGKVVRRGK